jgi:hypothetical protein
MKNLLRGSLLTLIFVGMNGFSSFTSEAEDFDRCDDIAGGAYIGAKAAGASLAEAAQIWVDTLLACTDAGGGSDATVVISN